MLIDRARWVNTIGLALLLCAGRLEAAEKERAVATFSEGQVRPLLAKYCTSCHGREKPKAGLDLERWLDSTSSGKSRKVWERVVDAIESEEMPPEGKPQPNSREREILAGWAHGQVARLDCGKLSDPGRVTIRRLNRAEYRNTIRDLFGFETNVADDFPSDDVGYGFDNIGDVLTLPPILFEKYLAAAEKIAEQAIVAGRSLQGPTKTWEAEDLGKGSGGSPYSDWARILPSQGEVVTAYDFPRSGTYVLRVRAFGQQAGPEVARMAFRVDGKTLKTVDVKAEEKAPGLYEAKVKLLGGRRRFSVAFLNDFYDANAKDPRHRDRNLVIDYLEVQGPLPTEGAPLPDSHRRIIFRRPTPATRDECARAILERFASRAYRRPVTAGEIGRLLKFVDLAQQSGESFERGIQLAVEAILVSPQFLFRVELDPRPRRVGKSPGASTGVAPAPHLINEFELASRLSYFLWSSMPDDELYQLAAEGKLRADGNLDKQVRRMLHDHKSRALVENFADQWLQVRNLKTVNPDKGRFPAFDDALRAAMLEETERYFEAVMREDRSVLDFLDANFTFLNERLARHYGIAGVKGEKFRRVSLDSERRGGLLTQASILTITSNPTRTSPVKRGKWILEQILGAPPPPQPPDVPDLKEDKSVVLSGTVRQRFEQHRANPSCASCHRRMDPLGFGLENYDAIGAWREQDGAFPVDASGTLPSGQTFRGSKALKAILKGRERDFTRCLAEKMLTYALGRGLEDYDTCAIDAIVDAVAKDHFCFSTLVREVVQSDPFQKRRARGDEPR